MTLPDIPEIARLEERRLARGMSEIADAFEPIGGGVMCKGPAGSWVNAAVGLGFDGPVDAAEVARLIAWYERDGIEPRIELAPDADGSLVRHLADSKFVIRVFESVFVRTVKPGERVAPIRPSTLDGLNIRRVDPSETSIVLDCATVVASGFTPLDEPVRPEDVETWERCAHHPRTTLFGAFVGNRCIGAGSVEVSGPISTLYGLSVLAPFRRRGVQQALMAERLEWAAAQGAGFSTISARPRVGTVRNAQRMGFQVAYTKVTLTRPGPALTAVAS